MVVGPDPICATHAPAPHLDVVVDDLEELARLRDPPRLQLGPQRHVVQGDLEGARGYQLRLDGVAQEEGHHAGVQLVFQHPGPPTGCRLTKILENVEAGENHKDDNHFGYTKKLSQL